jgi:hypothetical protein
MGEAKTSSETWAQVDGRVTVFLYNRLCREDASRVLVVSLLEMSAQSRLLSRGNCLSDQGRSRPSPCPGDIRYAYQSMLN